MNGKKFYEIQDEFGDCINRYRTFNKARVALDVLIQQRKADRKELEIKIERAKMELTYMKNEVLEIVEVEATEELLVWMKKWERITKNKRNRIIAKWRNSKWRF